MAEDQKTMEAAEKWSEAEKNAYILQKLDNLVERLLGGIENADAKAQIREQWHTLPDAEKTTRAIHTMIVIGSRYAALGVDGATSAWKDTVVMITFIIKKGIEGGMIPIAKDTLSEAELDSLLQFIFREMWKTVRCLLHVLADIKLPEDMPGDTHLPYTMPSIFKAT